MRVVATGVERTTEPSAPRARHTTCVTQTRSAANSVRHINLLSHVHTSNNVETSLSNANSQTILSTNHMLLCHCCHLWRQCRTKFRPFDKVETNRTCLIGFYFVERTKFYDNVASTKSNVVSTLLLVWTGL